MELQIQDLVSSIKKDGIDSANQEAAAILADARKQADAIVADAKAEADKLRGDARAEIEVFKSSAQLDAQQAKRDAVLAFRQEIQREYEKLLSADVGKALDQQALVKLIQAAVQGEDVAAYTVEVGQVTDGLRQELAQELCQLNRERQAIEAEIYTECQAMAEALPQPQRHALVLAGEQWHQGVVGIVASRLAEKYSCPAFMICLQDGKGKGSCRSFAGFNLFAALERCAPLLEGFGGHALAAGFTIREENIPAFAAAMNDYVCACTGGEEMVSALDIDGELDDVGLLTLEGVEGLELLEPYGAGNPKPVFSLSGCLVSAVNEVGGGRHLKLKLTASGRSFDAIFFSATAEEAGVGPGDRVDVAFTPQINEYRGWRSVQLQLCDLRPALTRAQAERALYEKFRRGEPLTRQEAEALLPSREEFVTLWRYLKGHAGQAPLEATAHRLARSIARSAGRRETVMRTLVCLEVFDERGLIRLEHTTDHLHIALRSVDGKVNLDDSCIMRKLRHILSNG